MTLCSWGVEGQALARKSVSMSVPDASTDAGTDAGTNPVLICGHQQGR